LSLFDEVAARIGQTAAGLAISAARRSLPAGMGPLVNTGINTAGKVLSGDFGGAAAGVLDSGVLVQHFPFLTGLASNALFMVTPTPLFGGISPMEARRIYDQCQAEAYARKNLFLVEVSGRDGNDGAGEFKFNLFATDVSYSPYTLSGDKQKIGAANVDLPTSGEPVELSITTLDDQAGTLKRWFGYRAAMVTHADGSVGLPAEYLLKIRILHSFITPETGRDGYGGKPGDAGYYRPVNLELSLSRREDALEELQMTFTQFDTFVPVI
jgi:hypothetical protein